MKKLYAVSVIQVRKQETMNCAIFVGLAESAEEAGKMAIEGMERQFPAYKGWRVHGEPNIMQVADDMVYSAHENLKAIENA